MKAASSLTQQAAEGLAIQALTFIAGDGERLGRFLATTGIGPVQIRAAAQQPGFLVGVLEHGTPADRLAALAALKSARGLKFVDLARATLPQAGPTLGTAAASAALPEHVSKTKNVAENIPEILKDRRIKSRRTAASSAHSRVPKPVV